VQRADVQLSQNVPITSISGNESTLTHLHFITTQNTIMKTIIDEDSMSPPPSYSSSILDQIDNRARGNTRMKDDGNNDDIDLEHLLFAATNWKSAGSDPAIP